MARMIYQRDSTATHLRMGRRHIRLCGHIAGAKKYAADMQKTLDALKEKEKERKAATDVREDAYDDVILRDTQLDNAVRTAFEKTRQYDRDHTTRMLDLLFPSRGFSDLVNSPLSKEPQDVNKLIVKLEGLDAQHELKQLIPLLREKTDASTAAWNAYRQAIDQQQEKQASEELTKLAVRQRYEHDWLDARKEFGATVADSIFPKFTSKPASHENSEATANSDE